MFIRSGGQTGVDLAALRAARQLGLPNGGWVPRGRLNEEGVIAAEFSGLRETPTSAASERTRLNVLASDVLLVITSGSIGPGTQLAIRVAESYGIPTCSIDLGDRNAHDAANTIRSFLLEHAPHSINIAGPRESESPGIGARAEKILLSALHRPRVSIDVALANLRHWDTIRWGVPAGYLFASGTAFLGLLNPNLWKNSIAWARSASYFSIRSSSSARAASGWLCFDAHAPIRLPRGRDWK